MSAPILAAVMGPTASGKTGLAEQLADRLDARLLNADAFQIYRLLDVGTSKPKNKHRYDLVDIRNPDDGFGVGEWVALAQEILESAWEDRRNVVVVGGTGLYVRALFEQYRDMKPPPSPEIRKRVADMLSERGLPGILADLRSVDPAAAAKVDCRNPVRVSRALEKALTPDVPLDVVLPPFRKAKLALDPPIEVLGGQIERRLLEMMQNGWVREVESLRNAGYAKSCPAMRAIGYRDVWAHVEGEIAYDEAIARIAVATKQYAKRQRTWLRTEPQLRRLEWGMEEKVMVAEAMERIA